MLVAGESMVHQDGVRVLPLRRSVVLVGDFEGHGQTAAMGREGFLASKMRDPGGCTKLAVRKDRFVHHYRPASVKGLISLPAAYC